MSTPKRQHYVPQFYLRLFARNNKIFVFDKFNNHSFPSTVHKIASRRKFYDIPKSALEPHQDEQQFEKDLSKLEEACAPLIKYLAQGGGGSKWLSYEQKRNVAYYLTVQIARTKRFREEYLDCYNNTLNTLNNFERTLNLDDEPEEDPLENSDDRALKGFLGFLLESRENIIEELCRHIWIVGFHKGPTEFYTSGNPVAMFDPTDSPLLAANRLLGDGAEIAFPLSPTHVLWILERKKHAHHEKHDNSWLKISNLKVEHFNWMQVRESRKYIFSRTGDFEFARGMCRQNHL